MEKPAQTELFVGDDPHAKYAVDLLTRLVRKVEESSDYNVREFLGDELWDEVCHAIGWDIDWEALCNHMV